MVREAPLGDRLNSSSVSNDSDSDALEDYVLSRTRSGSVNHPVPFTDGLIKRLSECGNARPS